MIALCDSEVVTCYTIHMFCDHVSMTMTDNTAYTSFDK